MFRRLGPWIACVVAALGCGAPEQPAQAPAVAIREEARRLPDDVDIAVRVDVDWLTAELGPSLGQRLLLDVLVGPEPANATPLLGDALLRSRLLWLGFRWGEPIHAAEKVLILRGQFRSPTSSEGAGGWAAADPAPGRPAFFFRETSRPGALSRIYSRGPGLLLWASDAEVESVEEILAGRASDAGASLRPPERGALSVALRPEPLRVHYSRAYPRLAQRFAGARSLQGYLDVRAGRLALELELGFESEPQASDARGILEQLRSRLASSACVFGATARAARLSVFERELRVLAQLEPSEVGALEACLLGGRCCV